MARAMRDSGIEWIGEIPEEWEVTSIGRLYLIKAGGDLDVSNYSDVLTDIHKYPIYANKQNKNDIYGYTSIPKYKGNSITVTGRGDVGIAFYRECEYDAIIRLLVLTPKYNIKCKFHEYFINFVLNFNEGSSAIQQLSTQQLSPYKVCLPTFTEQQTIADFLDIKCSLIDSTIEKQKAVIEKLKHYKQSLITEVVTKGLDATANMKPSGIEWTGDIPEEWEVRKLKNLVELKNDKSSLNSAQVYVGLENVESWTGKYLVLDIEFQNEGIANCFNERDILFGKLRPYLAKCWIATFNGKCSSEFLVLRSLGANSNLLNHSLLSHWFINIVDVSTYGAKMPRASWSFIGEILMPIPPIQEQQAIADYLDSKCSQIENIINSKEKLIEKLTAFKKSLIYECVTGKRDCNI